MWIFEIPHKISYPYIEYIERYDFYTTLKFKELLDLRAHMRFWNAPQVSSRGPLVVHINTLKSEQMVDTLLMIFSGSLKQKSLYFNLNFIEVLALVAQWFVYEQSLLESMATQFIGTYTYQQASMS